MVRTQIQLTEEQAARLKRAAARRGVSMAELIRQGLDALLAQGGPPPRDEIYRRARQAAGKHRSGKTDISARHDEYLTEGYSR